MIFQNELELYKEFNLIAGVDEAGRGPLAGPVVVAAVILGNNAYIEGLNDSKKVSEKKREILFDKIKQDAISWSICFIEPEEIDKLNILQATLSGMAKVVEKLSLKPDLCLIDGNKIPKQLEGFSKAIVKGDSKYASISAASILAKVARDRFMLELHEKYPQYNFKQHKGYPTKEHLAIINKIGICPYHRKSYKPVQQLTIDFDNF